MFKLILHEKKFKTLLMASYLNNMPNIMTGNKVYNNVTYAKEWLAKSRTALKRTSTYAKLFD